MNILSFDIEEWYIEKHFYGGRKDKYYQFDEILDNILNLLDEKGCKATFFCLGKIASEFPNVVKKIVSRDHEIGCHSDVHLWLTKMTPDQLRQDTIRAIAALEDVSGQEVISYRAPAFSIGEKNKWALEILYECGIRRDASIFPAVRDFGGFSTFEEKQPCIIETNGYEVKEFPVPLVKIAGKDIAYSGGGYFRFFPLWFISQQLKTNDYGICYFHIGDLIQESSKLMSRLEYENYFKEPGTLLNRFKRYVKVNLGKRTAFTKMQNIIKKTDFSSLQQADKDLFWDRKVVL